MVIKMKCSYCDQPAIAKCACSQPYMCQPHFGSHFLVIGNHPFEAAKVFDAPKQSRVKDLAIKRIHDIDISKSKIELKTKTLINKIVGLHKLAIERLEDTSKIYFGLLEKNVFFDPEVGVIENLEKIDVTIHDINTDGIINEIEKLYLQDLVFYSERIENERKENEKKEKEHNLKEDRIIQNNEKEKEDNLKENKIKENKKKDYKEKEENVKEDKKKKNNGKDDKEKEHNKKFDKEKQDNHILGSQIIDKERPDYQKVMLLNKYVGGFRCGAITSNYKILVTGGFDSTIRVWDLIEKKQILVLYGHYGWVQQVVIVESSQHIISASVDATVRIWSLLEKKQVAILRGHMGLIYSLCFIEASSLIISGGDNNELIIWDFSSYLILKKLNLPGISFCIIPINQFNIIIGLNSNIVHYDLEKTSILSTLKGHKESVWTLKLTNDEKKLISGSYDETIIIWDLITKKKKFHLKGKLGVIRSIALTLDEKFFVTSSDDLSVRIWNTKTGKQVNVFKKHTLEILCILRENDNFLSLSKDGSIGTLDMENYKFKLNWFLEPFIYEFMDFTGNLGLIGYGSKNKAIIWDLDREKYVFDGHIDDVQFVEISNDRRFAISGSSGSKKNLIYWSLYKDQKVCELNGHSEKVCCAAFSKDCMLAASGSADKTVIIWNLTDMSQARILNGHTGCVFSIKFIDNKKLVVSAGEDDKIRVWRMNNWSIYTVMSGHSNEIFKIIITEDERYIISANLYDGIIVWDVDERQKELSFEFENLAKNWLMKNRISLESFKRYLKA